MHKQITYLKAKLCDVFTVNRKVKVEGHIDVVCLSALNETDIVVLQFSSCVSFTHFTMKFI